MYTDNDIIDWVEQTPTLGAGNIFEQMHQQFPGHRSVILLDQPLAYFNAERICLFDLIEVARRLSAIYLTRGVRRRDTVALYLEDNLGYLVNYIALTRIGVIPLFINGQMPVEIAAQFIEKVACNWLLVNDQQLTLPAELEVRGIALRLLREQSLLASLDGVGRMPEAYEYQPDDVVLLAHTSGTTGIPKAVQFAHQGFFYGVRMQVRKILGQRFFNAMPHSHASALSMMMSFLIKSSDIHIQTEKQPYAVFNALETFKPDIFASFPRVYTEMCREGLEGRSLDSIACWLSTGDANHKSHIQRLITHGQHQRNGQMQKGSVFIDNFGSSEFGFAAFRNIHSAQKQPAHRCIGKPFDWVEAEVLSEQGRPMPEGEVGLLGVASPSVTPGYWNDHSLTVKNRLGKYWLTGDLAYRDAEGRFFHVDRTIDHIALDGKIFYSTQLEEMLMWKFEQIFDCTITTKDSDKALFVRCEVIGTTDQLALESKIRQQLLIEGIELPVSVTFNTNVGQQGVTGKVLKRAQRETLI